MNNEELLQILRDEQTELSYKAGGTNCLLCDQKVKRYRRKITTPMAKTLIEMWKAAEFDFVHTPSLPGDTHEASQLAWWGLIAEELTVRPDGGRAGFWRVTQRGHMFMRGLITVPKYAQVYNGVREKFVGDERASIEDALGTPFNFKELMNGE